MTVTIRTGDCRNVIKTLSAGSVHTCVTSPPYFGLRDYGVANQIGLEPTPEEFIAELVAVFREVKRVLRDDGTLWLNIGDSYAGSWGARGRGAGTNAARPDLESKHGTAAPGRHGFADSGIKPKDMIGIPWMLAFALRADGWYLRQDIIWSKPNPMPESVRDRCTKAHEYIFLLSKSERYYFDAEAIREPLAAASIERLSQNIADQKGSARVPGKNNGMMKAVQRGTGVGFGHGTDAKARNRGRIAHSDKSDETDCPAQPDMRNKRSVWTVATQPFKEAHFATFPPTLIEPCILAGSRVGGTVLDPFGGAGTTGLVSEKLGRDSILIELNPEYAEMATDRTSQGGLILV